MWLKVLRIVSLDSDVSITMDRILCIRQMVEKDERSLIQKSPTDCDVSECDQETS